MRLSTSPVTATVRTFITRTCWRPAADSPIPALCRIIADESCARIQDLISLGMAFDCKAGVPVQTKLSGCSKARSLTCGGSTGVEMLRALAKGHAEAGVESSRACAPARPLAKRGWPRRWRRLGSHIRRIIRQRAPAKSASAPEQSCWRQAARDVYSADNVNPPTLEGDGWAMAYRAGARLVNMEFFQVGPAVMWPKIQFIIHSHMWKLKPRLTNARGGEFLANYCPSGVVPEEVLDAKILSYPFSVRTVAKYLDIAIFKELTAGRGAANGGVYFDVTHVSEQELRQKAPITYQTLKDAGVDLAKQKIELGLVVQNFNGGILIDEDGSTGVEGLYAAGEVTGGVHGADRPGGNNLIDTQVFGCRAGRAASEFALSVRGQDLQATLHNFRAMLWLRRMPKRCAAAPPLRA